MDLNKLVEDFVKHCMYNKKSTMEYYDEIKEMRENTIPQFRKIVEEHFSRFCLNNGLWNRLDFPEIDKEINNDETKALIKLWTLGNTNYKFKNRYLNGLVDWFLDKNINKEMKDIKTIDEWTMMNKKGEEIKVGQLFYSKVPPLYLKLKDIQKDKYSITPSDKLIKYFPTFVKIGKSIQFNVKGFSMNETLWLLMGMAIVYVKLNFDFKDGKFKDLINMIRVFVQLNITSICLEANAPKEPNGQFYNLITFLKTEGGYNYRYKCAEKYFKEYKKIGQTDYKIENGKAFILTEYSSIEEYLNKWNELEEEFRKNKLTKELIVKWFDSQLLTRSTCLVGCILIVLMESKIIEFNKDEMPDWKSIAVGNFDDTYIPKEDLSIPVDVPEDWKLVDVLSIIAYYISTLKK